MTQKIVLQNEIVKVKGRVKAVTIKKEDFDKFLKLTKLRVLDKTYDALMPPIDEMKKNTVDLNGLAQIIQEYMASFLYNTSSASSPTPAQIVLSTSSGSPITLSYTSKVNPNSQGVLVYLQIFESNGNFTFQYYFIGFDTTNNSYSVTQAELYASAWSQDAFTSSLYYTNLIRIAYTNVSITKSSTEYLFLVWLLEFQNVPSYITFTIPIFQNIQGLIPNVIVASPSSSVSVYFYINGCNFTCGGNCPGAGLSSFITYIQNNSLILEFPTASPLGSGVSQLEVLICTTMTYSPSPHNSNVVVTISGNGSNTVTPPVSGATLYVAIVTISITFTGS